MNMGGRIAERLAELNWSQTDLVDRALQFCPDPDKPLTIKTLSAIIKRDNIASQWSEPIALALGVTHSWLVWGVGEKFPDGQDRHVPLPWPLFSVDPKQWAALPRSKKKKIDDFAHGVVAGHNSERAPGSGGSLASNG